MKCDHCQKTFSRKFTLVRHQNTSCPVLNRKRKNVSPGEIPSKIQKCEKNTVSNQLSANGSASTLSNRGRLNLPATTWGGDVEKLNSAFKNRIASFRFTSAKKVIDYSEFFEELKQKVLNIIMDSIQKYHSVKINLEVFGSYVIPEKEISDVKSFNTKNQVVTKSTDLQKMFEKFLQEMISQASEFQEKDSGWTLKQIMFLDVNINKFSPLSASSYIQLPKALLRKQAVLNIKNRDNACFAWSIIAAIFPSSGDKTEVSSYPHYETLLNFTGLQFPMKLKDISKFETMNNISVNVYGVETDYIYGEHITEVVGPLHFTSHRQPTHINLLLLSDTTTGINHYCLITDLSRLVRRQKTKHKCRIHICDGCLQSFTTMRELQLHEQNDCTHVYVKLPSTDLKVNKYGEIMPGNILKFVNFEKQFPVPFVIYADFESLLKPVHHTEPCPENSYTVKVCEHEPYSFAFYVKCNFDDTLSTFVSYRGPNVAEVFIEKLDRMTLHLYNTYLKHVKQMTPLSPEEEAEFENSVCCHICEKSFDTNDIKVHDHSHLTGRFVGAAHSVCNLNYKIPKFIPVFFHNLNYDCSLFVKKLACKKETVSVIAQTKEKYISFSKSILVEKSQVPKKPDTYLTLKFVDTFRFLSKSLDKLSKTLESHQCIETRKYFQEEEKFNLLRRKGVFPYSYVDSFEKLEEPALPSKEKFYNDITKESITDEKYARAKNVWDIFQCKNLGEYADLYLKSDVLILADIFENFRKVCLREYKLDAAHYLTAPSLSWDAMLRYTGVSLELLTDINNIHFFRKGIRGGVSQCSKRKVIANNKFLQNYNPHEATSYIMYLDATNLYGAAMKEYLPTGDFRWLEEQEIEHFDCSVEKKSDKGYVLEVDLEYPHHLHDTHNDLPFCAEQMIPPNSRISKLIPNLRNKNNYIIHYTTLQQCLKHGLKLTKIHRVLEFSQSAWLASYIDLNTKLRNSGKGEFEKDLFKLMVNSIFGKTMENVDKRQNIKLCSSWETKNKRLGARALIALPQFKSSSVFDENLVAVQLEKVKIVYDKPLYVGFSILEISKSIIYDFLYGFIKPLYGDNATVIYTDTDSLILEIFTENAYDDIKNNIQYFDTSNYDVNNIHGIPQTQSVVGKMKDEYKGKPIECFYGTGAKAYCVQTDELTKKAKGISKGVIKRELNLSDYVHIIERGATIFRKMYIFKSTLHTMYTELKKKVALSSTDDKRCVDSNGITTKAWGHYALEPNRNLELLIQEAEKLEEEWDFDLNLFDL